MAPLFDRAEAVVEVLSSRGKGGGAAAAARAGGPQAGGGEGAGAAAGGGSAELTGRLPDAAVWQKLRK